MASHGLGECCYQGVKHEGEATGEMGKIGDIDTYLCYPSNKSTERAILLVPDIFGHGLINTRLIADQFAANGYFVMIPDLFQGDAAPISPAPGWDLMGWLRGPPGHEIVHVDPVIEATLAEMRGKYGCKLIGAAGYCFGAKYVIRHLRPDRGEIDVGFVAHPSLVEVAELSAITGPLSIAAAENDVIFTLEKRRKTEEILARMKTPFQINLFSGVGHGFGIRGDLKDPQVRFAKESAFLQAVRFFEMFLK